ncbi:hypothetical protein SAMN05660464_3778 [Geodermatophilus dictyosporus]|uniref:Uncharacterized protein n=1 Tax=Geodermatophilus dictyosporus TaxID=1523247 RepID=A0A1I5RXY1_9ACTN|nr:hypothetical protein [Geodermatophilus dictyosporus]SFP63382.1 hypothetical protein SAMN05660464_3778 [Geodermatophilus dictyosporus]
MSGEDGPRPSRGDWVTLTGGVRVSRTWMTRHTPRLLAAWCDATSGEERRAVAARILQIAGGLESEPDGDREPAGRAWEVLAARIDPRLVCGPDWPPLAAALDRAAAAGYDVAGRLPALAAVAPLPDRHPARELHWRLLDDCPAATPRRRGAAGRPPLVDPCPGASTAGPPLHRPRRCHRAPGRRRTVDPYPAQRLRSQAMTANTTTDPLDYAAALLDAVGADRAQVPAEIALHCLYAAELLELAGARPAPTELIDGNPRITLRVAMAALADLHEDVFASSPFLDAARAARRALRRLG